MKDEITSASSALLVYSIECTENIQFGFITGLSNCYIWENNISPKILHYSKNSNDIKWENFFSAYKT